MLETLNAQSLLAFKSYKKQRGTVTMFDGVSITRTNVNEKCHSTDYPKRMSGTLFSNFNNIQSMIPEDQKKKTTHNEVVRGDIYSRYTGTKHQLSCSKFNSTVKMESPREA